MFKKYLSVMIGLLLLITTTFLFYPEIACAQKLAPQTGFKLPDGFPAEIPFTDDAFDVKGQRDENNQLIMLNYKSDMKASDITTMYRDFIKKMDSGYKTEKDSTSTIYNGKFSGYEFQVLVINLTPSEIYFRVTFPKGLPSAPVYKEAPASSNGSAPVATNQSRLKLPAFFPKEIPFTKDAVLSRTEDNSYASAGNQNITVAFKSKLPQSEMVKLYKTFARNSAKENNEFGYGNMYSFNCKFEEYDLQINIEAGEVRFLVTPERGVFRNHYEKTDYSDGIVDKSGIYDPNLQVPKRLVAAPGMTDPYTTALFVKKNNNNLYGRGFNLYIGAKKDAYDRWENETVDAKWTLLDQNAYCLDAEGSNYNILKPDGSLWTYGTNHDYLLGNGEVVVSNDYPPAKILDNVRSADIGKNGTAVTKDGSLWIWGSSSALFSVLDKPTENRLKPEKVMDGVVDAAQSGSVGWDLGGMIIVLKTDGSLWTWGEGNCGDGGLTWKREKPIKVMNGVKAIEASNSLCCVIKKDNSLWVWESHNTGQNMDPGLIKPKKLLTDVKMVSLGQRFLTALKMDGSVWTYGDNTEGQCGIGSTKTKYLSTPQKILSGVVEVASAETNAFALMSNGKVMGWGEDNQLNEGYDWLKLKGDKVLKPTDIGFGTN